MNIFSKIVNEVGCMSIGERKTYPCEECIDGEIYRIKALFTGYDMLKITKIIEQTEHQITIERIMDKEK